MVARALSQRLACELVVTDDLIVAKENKPIMAIFKEHGEKYFRDLEVAIIKEVASRRGIIIDCGGGVVLRQENLQVLKKSGIVFYLQAAPEVVYNRIKHETHRPLLNTPDPLGCIKELYDQRLPLYTQADYTIDANDASIEGPITEILKKI